MSRRTSARRIAAGTTRVARPTSNTSESPRVSTLLTEASHAIRRALSGSITVPSSSSHGRVPLNFRASSDTVTVIWGREPPLADTSPCCRWSSQRSMSASALRWPGVRSSPGSMFPGSASDRRAMITVFPPTGSSSPSIRAMPPRGGADVDADGRRRPAPHHGRPPASNTRMPDRCLPWGGRTPIPREELDHAERPKATLGPPPAASQPEVDRHRPRRTPKQHPRTRRGHESR